MIGDSPRQNPHLHANPKNLTQRDLIEQYYTRFIEIWQTSESVDEAHHRTLSTLDPGLTESTAFTGRAHFLSTRGVKLKELKPYTINWSKMADFASSFLEED